MTIGVPTCRDTERCGVVAERLALERRRADVVVALDDDGMACGWLDRKQLGDVDPAVPVGDVMDEDIPTVRPDIPAEAAAQLMRDRGAGYLFLMHDWPGEPRPSAVVSLDSIERRLAGTGAQR